MFSRTFFWIPMPVNGFETAYEYRSVKVLYEAKLYIERGEYVFAKMAELN